ncbi:serine protease inhibitor Kazal-type 1-like [Pyxicephalus adspersus]|uniref:serine protease inhibitor Kazal-type 1-like n=1 Tax=Pyxicephalus adspersus TaxID=30357 RepID=UPI003B5C3A20
MRFLAFLSILAIFLLCLSFGPVNTKPTSDEGREPVCEEISMIRCPRNYEPVCGSDNWTYDNECLLCREMIKKNIRIRITKNGKC